MRFCKKGKLSPRYVGLYEILQRVGKVAYDLTIPCEFSSVHSVLHVYNLKTCIGDPESILSIDCIGVEENLSYVEVPVEIIYRQVNKLRNKEVDSVRCYGETWEVEADMKVPLPLSL